MGGATCHLTRLERGTYHDLLVLMWRTPGCRVPNDDAWLGKQLRMTPEEVKKELRPIIEEFCRCEGNWVTQKRLSKEYNFVTRASRLRSDGAKSMWKNKKGVSRAYAGQHMAGSVPIPIPTSTSSSFTEPRDPPPVENVDNSRPPEPEEPPQAVTEEASKREFVFTPYVPKDARPPAAAPTSTADLAAKYGPIKASPQLEAILRGRRR